jgi:Hg(II)-responsive transcriptional regulator
MVERTISRAAEKAGVGVETIRFYERRGLIKQPARPRDGGYRSYDDGVVERIRFIRQAQDLGFSLREIAELLSLRANPATDCRDIRARAACKRADVDQKIAQLQRIRGALDELIASCPGGGALRSCTIMDALTQHARGQAAPTVPSMDHRAAKKGRGVKTAIFKIEGMHCDGCAETIKAMVGTVPGVRAADVSFGDRQARILYEPKSITEDELVTAVEGGGRFRVTVRSV